jgi:murein DD-endopeptidase MepM/ murein hydrolase activator NlpD
MESLSKLNQKSLNLPRFIIFIVLGLFLFLGISLLPSQKVTATDIPPEIIAANNWQHASFPVETFHSYSSPFGYRRSPTGGNTREFHRGLDIVGPLGSYIRNWWSGQVIDLTDNTACGTSITIRSGEWTHVYCHLMGRVRISGNSRYLSDPEGGIELWLGEQVSSGARIGRIGMTGRTTGPHLHWGLKYSGKYVDPGLVLQEMYKEQNA